MKLVDSTAPILRQPAQKIDFQSLPFDLNGVAVSMLEAMERERGIGLAGPQVGIPYQIFVMGDHQNKWVVINPEIISSSEDQTTQAEGCLSFPYLKLKVKRPSSVSVRYQDTTGTIIEEQLTDVWARCYQHEKDHVDGICFDKRVGKVSLSLAKKKQEKLTRSYTK